MGAGLQRQPVGRGVVRSAPVITTVPNAGDGRQIPFIGLVEATVVQAFRQTGLPMQRIRRRSACWLARELAHTLASRQLYSDGAEVLYAAGTSTTNRSVS